ncbi:MAG: peroxiredoxin family protein [Planctomycetota bacterium]
MNRTRLLLLLPALLLFPLAIRADETGTDERKPYQLGDKVVLLKHKDLAGGDDVDLPELLKKSERGVILVWYSPICPACVKHSKELSAIKEKHAKKGWTVVGVFSGSSAGPKRLTDEQHKRYYKDQAVAYPVLDDRDQRYNKPFGLRKTPTTAAITKDGRLGFLGAPWDLKSGKQYLADYVEAEAAGKEAPKVDSEELTAWG